MEGEDETDGEEEEDDDNDNDDNNVDAEEREDTQQNQPHVEPAKNNLERVATPVSSQGPGTSHIKGPRQVIYSKPTVLKKRYMSSQTAQQIIPSGTTNPSSDGPVGYQILARTSPQHSPPSSPPQEARRREQSPTKRRMTTRSTK